MIAIWIDCPREDCPRGVTTARLMWDEDDRVIGVRGECGHITLPQAE